MVQIGLPHTERIFCDVVDSTWHNLDIHGPLYYDGEQSIYPYPTVYTSDSSANYLATISYNDTAREWIHTLTPIEPTGNSLEVHAYARSIPFWLGKPAGPYVIHGACKINEDIDTWGAFWDVGTMEVNLTINDTTYIFYGGFLFDRAYHRVFYSDSAAGSGCGAPLSFSCCGIQQENLDIMIAQSIKPPGCPVQTPVPFQHQGRINFPSLEEDFTFDNFIYSDNGGLQPSEHYLTGTYTAGEVNLTGEVFMFWPALWQVNQGVYWDNTLNYVWGRAFIKWNGFVTLYGDTIEVNDAMGLGEFTRCEPESSVIKEETKYEAKNMNLEIFPNPSLHRASISYYIPESGEVILKIYNIAGQEVATLVAEQKQRGAYKIDWDTIGMGSGVYFCQLRSDGNFFQTKKLLVYKR